MRKNHAGNKLLELVFSNVNWLVTVSPQRLSFKISKCATKIYFSRVNNIMRHGVTIISNFNWKINIIAIGNRLQVKILFYRLQIIDFWGLQNIYIFQLKLIRGLMQADCGNLWMITTNFLEKLLYIVPNLIRWRVWPFRKL